MKNIKEIIEIAKKAKAKRIIEMNKYIEEKIEPIILQRAEKGGDNASIESKPLEAELIEHIIKTYTEAGYSVNQDYKYIIIRWEN